MKLITTTAILTFFLLTYLFASGQTIDTTKIKPATTTVKSDTSTHSASNDPYAGTDDFSPGLAFFALLGLGFICLCVGVGIVITVGALLIIFGLISVGILSASILVGVNKKSLATGFKTFLVSSSTIGGLVICGLGLWLLNKITHWWTTKTAIIIGATCGLLAGFIFGLLAFYILQQLTTFLKKKLNLSNE